MALFKVNTGCRDGEVCSLRWDWEVEVTELETSVFIIPDAHVKNGDERLVVLNDVAKSVIESMRGKHPVYVFTYRGKPTGTMHNSGWQNARKRVGMEHVRVHDLKHTLKYVIPTSILFTGLYVGNHLLADSEKEKSFKKIVK